ncbi:hypothetical protein [Frankia gtarii]|uniref:hypothetical protein n=1 Tax=Frankia gtarii TaxID=2950102 RepID=UPI0021BFEC2B|nr:hypothetical protein [Frankia gtarii]
MSSLVRELDDRGSPITVWLRVTFPHHRPVQTAYRARAGTARQLPPIGVAHGTQGAAIDWWIRFLIDPEPSPYLAVWSCLRAGPTPWARAGLQMLSALGAVDDDFTQHAVDPAVWHDRPDPWMARVCYALALLVEPLRNPAALHHSRLSQLTPDAGPRELMALATADEVTDLIAMRHLAQEHLLPAVAGQPAESGPTFEGSTDLNADADLVVSGLLLDIKASQGGTPRKNGTRTMSLTRGDLDQLLGYALLDYTDAYALHSVGHYLARFGTLITWPLDDLCAELAGHPVSLAETRAAFRRVVQEDLPAYWARTGGPIFDIPGPDIGAFLLDLPPKPERTPLGTPGRKPPTSAP